MTTLRAYRRLLPALFGLLVGCSGPCKRVPEPDPTPTDQGHPFAASIEGAVLTPELPPDPQPTNEIPKDLYALDVQTVRAPVRVGDQTIDASFEHTREVPPAHLKALLATLRAVPYEARRDDETPLQGKAELQRGEPEVRLPALTLPNSQRRLVLVPSDAWELVRPNIIRLKPEYRPGTLSEPGHIDGVGVIALSLTGRWSEVRGTITCDTGEGPEPLIGATIEVGGGTTRTDASGLFRLDRNVTQVDFLRVIYDGTVRRPPNSARLMVMDEWHGARSEHATITAGTTTGALLDLGAIRLTSLDCELFVHGEIALGNYLTTVGRPPPAGDLRIKRWTGVYGGTPYAFFDYVVIGTDFLTAWTPRAERRATMFHELGHTVRHAADGDLHHWNWDNFRWVYARNHSGNEVFNEQYAFNEGWGQYWECTRPGAPGGCPGTVAPMPSAAHLDWVELLVGARLRAMSAAPSVSHARMVGVLESNRGTLHTLFDFERAYCRAVPLPNPFCRGDRTPVRTKAPCPPDYIDEPATCRLDNIRAKPSYGRGVGVVPDGCGPAGENNAGLCYASCPSGFDGVGPVCWQRCPSGYHDDGAFCRKDVHIMGSDNGACPWYDKCGLTFARGCSTCPAGYHNDGCTCRRDAHIFAKSTHPRGAGTIPTRCSGGRVYDAGLCYQPCNAGFSGVGPVCWGSCDAGWADHGATCYRAPNVIVKF